MSKQETAQHTPGPWRVNDSDTVLGAKGNVVAECLGYSVKATDPSQRAQGGREANARLIAAAPDLLEACEGAAVWIHDADDTSPEGIAAILEHVNAAIAKARP